MDKVVLDTSVIVKWFSIERGHKQALKILNKVVNREIVLVEPELLFYELINAFWFGKKLTARQINEVFNKLTNLEPEIVSLDSKLISSILKFVNRFPITAYDASFIALANKHKIPLITADSKHHKKSFSKFIVPLI